MSSFKKFRIDNQPNTTDLTGYIKHQTPTTISRLSDLDKEIESVLSQNIDDHLKAKLFTQTLSKYLTLQKIKKQEEIVESDRVLENLKNILAESFVEKSVPKKKKKAPKEVDVSKVPKVIEDNSKDILLPKKKKKITKLKTKKTPKKKKIIRSKPEDDSSSIKSDDIAEYLDTTDIMWERTPEEFADMKAKLTGKGLNWDYY